jgi:hypothetical protein
MSIFLGRNGPRSVGCLSAGPHRSCLPVIRHRFARNKRSLLCSSRPFRGFRGLGVDTCRRRWYAALPCEPSQGWPLAFLAQAQGNHRCGGRALVGYIAVRRPLTLEVWRVFSPVVAPSRRCWPGATCRCKQPAGRGHARPGTITMCTHHRLFYDGNEVANISNRAGYNDYDPQNSASGLVVWSGRVEKDWEIFLWDGKQIEGADIL